MMLGNKNEVKATCKRCGKASPADKYVLDPIYKMMVCPACVAERKDKATSQKLRGGSGDSSDSGSSANAAAAAAIAGFSKAAGVQLSGSGGSGSSGSGGSQARTTGSSMGSSGLRSSAGMRSSSQQAPQAAPAPHQQSSKPAGWDPEDEMLDRAYKEKQAKVSGVEVVDDHRIKYACAKCKYKFVYDKVRRYPESCPYCGTPANIPKNI